MIFLFNFNFFFKLFYTVERFKMTTFQRKCLFAIIFISISMISSAFGRNTRQLNLAITNLELESPEECFHANSSDLFGYTGYTCKFLRNINKNIVQEYYNDLISAKNAVEEGNAWGAMYFTDNFTDALIARIVLNKNETDQETIQQSTIQVWFDNSNDKIKHQLTYELESAYVRFLNELKNDMLVDIKIDDLIQFNFLLKNISNNLSEKIFAKMIFLALFYVLKNILNSTELYKIYE